jgi:tRNA 2-thiouridine synthesizing protein E
MELNHRNITAENVKVDKEGYLKNADQWDEGIAEWLAKREGISLTDDHRVVIDYLRVYYEKHKSIPPEWKLTKVFIKRFSKSLEWFYSLFGGKEKAVDIAFKIAGFPKQYG